MLRRPNGWANNVKQTEPLLRHLHEEIHYPVQKAIPPHDSGALEVQVGRSVVRVLGRQGRDPLRMNVAWGGSGKMCTRKKSGFVRHVVIHYYDAILRAWWRSRTGCCAKMPMWTRFLCAPMILMYHAGINYAIEE